MNSTNGKDDGARARPDERNSDPMRSMKDNDAAERAVIAERAADWYVRRKSQMTAAEREAFAKWVGTSRLHLQEFLVVESVAHRLRTLGPGDFDVDELIKRARDDTTDNVQPLRPKQEGRENLQPLRPRVTTRPAVRWLAAAASLAALGVLGFFVWSAWNAQHERLAQGPSPNAASAVTQLAFATRHGQQSTERLPDGSVLHLNTDTAVSVRYSASRRDLVLLHGQAVFEVVHDPQRLFTVTAGSAEVTDVGTKFDVDLEHDATVVTVVEGLVEVAPAPGVASAPSSPRQRSVKLSANQQLSVSSAEEWPSTPRTVDAQRTTAWLRRQIVFEHQPLERVAAEFNRYTSVPIEIVTPSLRELQISGVFSTDDPEAFIAFLRSLDGVDVKVTATRVVVEGKPPASKRAH
jgi:transmembrane sensor